MDNVWLESLRQVTRFAAPVARQTLFLFFLDSLTNITDYAFHIYLGRVLEVGDFAIFQTVNSALLVVITALGVFQPVVARFVASKEPGIQKAVFSEFFGWGSIAGAILAGGVWLAQGFIASWLNVPSLAVVLGAGVVVFAFSRPVIWGMLQGQQRFGTYGFTRFTFAIGRFGIAIILIGFGWAGMGAVAALPLGTVLSLGIGILFLGNLISSRVQSKENKSYGIKAGLQLSGYALLAYLAYTALLNNDLFWVNRTFSPDEAGVYAGAVLLRRILLLLPGAILVIFYPRAVTQFAKKQLPDRLLLTSMGVIAMIILSLTAIYFAIGDQIVRLAFGEAYVRVGPLLGWMGLAILGFSLGSIWMNLALATNPAAFVGLLVLSVGAQWLGFSSVNCGLFGVVWVFLLTGWGLALGGAAIYFGWERPRLVSQWKNG